MFQCCSQCFLLQSIQSEGKGKQITNQRNRNEALFSLIFALLGAHQAYHPPCASSFLITTQWWAIQIFPLQPWPPNPYQQSHSPDQVWPPTLVLTQPKAILVLLPSFFLFTNRGMFVFSYNCHATESLTDTGQQLSLEISRNNTSFLCCWTLSLSEMLAD